MHEHADRDRTEPRFDSFLDRDPGRPIDMPIPSPDSARPPFGVGHVFDLEPGDTGRPFLPGPVGIDTTVIDTRVIAALDHAHDITTGACIKNRHRVPCDAAVGRAITWEPGSVARYIDPDLGEPNGAPGGNPLHGMPATRDAASTIPTDEQRRARYATALDLHSFALASTYWQRFVLRVMAVADAEIDAKADRIREHYAGQVAKSHRRAEAAEAQVEQLREAPFACDTHMCGSCKGCRAANVRDWITEKSSEIVVLERQLADHRAHILAMAERHSEHLHHATERAKTAETTVARVRSVCRTTDDEWLDGDAEIPAGEVLRMLYPDGLPEPEPCPHTCSCTSDQECPHDCPCDTRAGA